MFQYSMLELLLGEAIEDLLHSQTIKEQLIPLAFRVFLMSKYFSAGHFVIDFLHWADQYKKPPIHLYCGADMRCIIWPHHQLVKIDLSSGFSNPHISPASEVLWICLPGAAVPPRLITRVPLLGVLKCAEVPTVLALDLCHFCDVSMASFLKTVSSVEPTSCELSVFNESRPSASQSTTLSSS
jgi:hypothetical protein